MAGGDLNSVTFSKAGEEDEIMHLLPTAAYSAKEALFAPIKHQRKGPGLSFIVLGTQNMLVSPLAAPSRKLLLKLLKVTALKYGPPLFAGRGGATA